MEKKVIKTMKTSLPTAFTVFMTRGTSEHQLHCNYNYKVPTPDTSLERLLILHCITLISAIILPIPLTYFMPGTYVDYKERV